MDVVHMIVDVVHAQVRVGQVRVGACAHHTMGYVIQSKAFSHKNIGVRACVRIPAEVMVRGSMPSQSKGAACSPKKNSSGVWNFT